MTDKEIVKSDLYENVPYMEECTCGTFNKVFTQGNEKRCEYKADVYVKCIHPKCDQYICFTLPVN